jgi:predicted  nucleic acid-binding Zn-ribbon protein
MAGPGVILREIHRLRRHAKDLKDESDRGPIRLKAQQARAAKQEETLRQVQENLKRLKVATHEKEVSLKTKFQQIAKHEKQLNEAGSKKEYDALKAEIASERVACGKLEDEILEGMAETEERTTQLPELERAVRQAKDEFGQLELEMQTRQAALTEQLEQTHRSLQDVEVSLPEDVRAQYNRLTAARGEDALAAVESRTCVACYTEVTAQTYNELLQGQFVLCKSCGRILYLPE